MATFLFGIHLAPSSNVPIISFFALYSYYYICNEHTFIVIVILCDDDEDEEEEEEKEEEDDDNDDDDNCFHQHKNITVFFLENRIQKPFVKAFAIHLRILASCCTFWLTLPT